MVPSVWVFFYGSYLNLEVLREVGLEPAEWEVAILDGFDLVIRPRANLVRSAEHRVYGIVATATHAELERLYTHAREVLGEIYLPEAVLTRTLDGRWLPSLTYICPAMDPQPADPAYVERIVGPGRRLGFPGSYLERLESFKPS